MQWHLATVASKKEGNISRQLTVRLSEQLSDSLESAARKMRRKRSEIVRLALEQYLEVGSSSSKADRVRGLLGAVDTGISDLAERHREYVVESLRGR